MMSSNILIPAGKEISFDTETTGLFPFKGDRPWCFSFCNLEGDTTLISFPVNPFTRQPDYVAELNKFSILKKFLCDPTITKIGHNIAFDIRMCEAANLKVQGPIICTMNLIRIVKSDAPMALKKFCKEYLGIGDEDEADLKEATRQARREGKAKGYQIYDGPDTDDGSLAPDYWLAPRVLRERYALTDAARAMAVYSALFPEIKKKGLEKIWDQEIVTWKILRAIEKRGIHIFPEKIKQQLEDLKKKRKMYLEQAWKITGKSVNLNSSPQLQKIFYKQLKESPKYWTESKQPSTKFTALKAMKHPLSKTVLAVRACNKTIEFMEQYKFFMQKHKDGCYYIHPNFHQAMTVTGRESCREPNLQQVASGRNDKGIEVLVEARSVFGPRPNYHMRSYDWKNIEVYIPAFASGDPEVKKILLEGRDFHQETSAYLSKILGQPLGRDPTKRVYFGIQYGMGEVLLAEILGLERDVAAHIKWGISQKYPVLWGWMDELKNRAAIEGEIRTAYGRVIKVSREETYKATNYYVQGTAGGMLREAKIKIHKTIKERHWDVHIVLPIHDELLIETPISKYGYADVDEEIVQCMQDNPELNMPIPIPVSISTIGKSWADKKKV